jgi:dihydroflavonol-4-reductase
MFLRTLAAVLANRRFAPLRTPGGGRLTVTVESLTIHPMKVFLTGGTGFVGSHFAELLLLRGATVYALVRDPSRLKGLQGLPIHALEGDLFSVPSLPKDLDFVFHLAAVTKARKPEGYYSANRLGTASIFRAVAAQNIRPCVVYVSSVAAGGPSPEGRGRRELDPASPVSLYGRSKYEGEEEALKFKDRFRVLILRAGAIYGPRDKDFLDYFKFQAKGLIPLLAGVDPLVSLIYIKDFIRAMFLCTQNTLDSGEVLNISDPRPTAWSELGRTAAGILGKKARKVGVAKPVMFTAALLSEAAGRVSGRMTALTLNKYREMKQGPWVADTAKAKALLGFESEYSLEQGLRETIAWYREQGLL